MPWKEMVEKRMSCYRVVVERDESGSWVARVPSVGGCHTYASSLRGVRRRIREALSLWVDDAAEANLDVDVRLPADLRRAVTASEVARARATEAGRAAAVATKETVRTFEKAGLSRRDTADLLGLSHQRVQQVAGD